MDREKVKKELLELNAEAYGLWVHDQKNEFLAQIGNVTDDALALLKEQEAVKPTINEYGKAYCICGENVGIIPNNKNLPSVFVKYCPKCGRRMNWEDENGNERNTTKAQG